jgi:hypothetical protein
VRSKLWLQADSDGVAPAYSHFLIVISVWELDASSLWTSMLCQIAFEQTKKQIARHRTCLPTNRLLHPLAYELEPMIIVYSLVGSARSTVRIMC